VTAESQHPLRHKASRVRVVTTTFDGNLSGLDTTVQSALQTLDDIAGGDIGDVTSVGDCEGGACFDGTADGGTVIELSCDGTCRYYFGNMTGSGDTYLEYNASDEQVAMVVGGTTEELWPDIITVSDLLLEGGDFLLLEDGTSHLVLD